MNRYDLSIDDWAMNDLGVIGQVYALKRNTISLEMNGKESDHHLCQVLPIPLTEEILVKNGWKKRALRYFTEWYGCFQINEQSNGKFYYANIPLNYVHELQHLLRLAGIEKSIEL